MSAGAAGCFVCDKHLGRNVVPGGAIYEDEWVYASHGFVPEGKSRTYLGTLFVEPKRHVPGIAELSDLEAKQIGLLSARLARALKETGDAPRRMARCAEGRCAPDRGALRARSGPSRACGWIEMRQLARIGRAAK